MSKSAKRLEKIRDDMVRLDGKIISYRERQKILIEKEKEAEREAILERLESEKIDWNDLNEYLPAIQLLKLKGIKTADLDMILNYGHQANITPLPDEEKEKEAEL